MHQLRKWLLSKWHEWHDARSRRRFLQTLILRSDAALLDDIGLLPSGHPAPFDNVYTVRQPSPCRDSGGIDHDNPRGQALLRAGETADKSVQTLRTPNHR